MQKMAWATNMRWDEVGGIADAELPPLLPDPVSMEPAKFNKNEPLSVCSAMLASEALELGAVVPNA